tara:strand:+ start:12386 stop:13468 length:1083 start_codon:yes stop_codon:yes gene_type:complete
MRKEKPKTILKDHIVYEVWDDNKEQKKLKWQDNKGHQQPMEYLNDFNNNSLTFIHIPKTGGTSINSMFPDSISLEETYYNIDWEQTPWAPMPTHRQELNTETNEIVFKTLRINNHKTAIQRRREILKDDVGVPVEELPVGVRDNGNPGSNDWSLTKAMIRNPYDRVISLYYFGKSFWKYKEGYDMPKYPNFNDWVESQFGPVSRLSQQEMHNLFSEVRKQSEWLPADNSKWFTLELLHKTGHLPNFYMPQFYFLTDNDNKIIVEDIIKLEDAKKDMTHKGGTDVRPDKHYSWHYNQKTYDIITNYYRMDLDHFNYEFENNIGTTKIEFEVPSKYNYSFKTEKSSYRRRHDGKKKTNYKGK